VKLPEIVLCDDVGSGEQWIKSVRQVMCIPTIRKSEFWQFFLDILSSLFRVIQRSLCTFEFACELPLKLSSQKP